MSDDFDLDILARILHANKFRSRRQAKRELRDLGVEPADAAALDQVLALIRGHDDAGEIHARAESIEAARLEGQRRRALDEMPPEGDLPEWLIGETPHWGRTFIMHLCPGGSRSFIGEVFDEMPAAMRGCEAHELDEGQVLSNITWLDEGPPDAQMIRELMREARRQLRIYDTAADRD